MTRAGRISEGIFLSDYLVKNGPTIADPANPFELSDYLRLGQTVTLTPPTIPGYLTPDSASLVLSADPSANIHTFVYTPVVSSVAFAAQPAPAGVTATLAASTLSLDTSKDCTHIESSQLLPSSSFTAPSTQTTPQRTLGGLNFTLTCTTPGGDATVTMKLNATIDSLAKLHVYKKDQAGKVTDITDHVTLTQNPTTKTISLSYNLIDGHTFDDDNHMNGQILDPIYITVDTDARLAETGSNLVLLAGVSGAVVTVSAILVAVISMRLRKTTITEAKAVALK